MSAPLGVDEDGAIRLSHCPDWCAGHFSNDESALSRHVGSAWDLVLDAITNWQGMTKREGGGVVDIEIRQWGPPGSPYGSFGAPVVRVELAGEPAAHVELTAPEARSVAAVLVRFADRIEQIEA